MTVVHLDSQYLTTKDEAKRNASKISTRICKKTEEVTPEFLANELAKGKSMVAGVMRSEKRLKENLYFQEVIALDFDDGTPIEDLVNNEFIQEHASFIYMTLSHKEEFNKSRVVFFLDKKLTTNEQVERVYNKLFEIFPNVDKGCKDSSRIFFGGKDFIEINFNNTFYIEDFIEDINIQEPKGERVEQDTFELAVDNVTGVDINEKPTWWLIRHGFDDLVKERLSVYKANVENQATAMNYINSINMRELLGFASSGNIHDLFSEDRHPSVDVYQAGSAWLYTRHSDDEKKAFTGNTVMIVQKLKKTSFMKSLMYLTEMMSLEFNVNEEIKQLNKEIDIYSTLLLSQNLEKTHPNVAKIFKDGRTNYATDVVAILQIMKNNIVEVDGQTRMITQLSARDYSEMLYGTKNKKKRVQTIINLMTTTDWIVKVNTDALPASIKEKVVGFQKDKNRKYHKSVLEYLSNGDDFFDKLDRKCGALRENNFTARATLTKEGLAKTLGEEEANKVFVQDKERKVSKLTNEVEDVAIDFIMAEIKKKGYVEEKAVVKYLSDWIGKTFSDFKFKQLRANIITGYGLERCRLNKALKKEFGVSDKYTQTQSPAIIKIA